MITMTDFNVYIPLSSGQKGLMDYYGHLPTQFLNLVARLDLESEIDEQLALEAMRLSVLRLPYCRLRLHDDREKGLVQYLSDAEPEGIELLDFSDKSSDWIDNFCVEQAGTAFGNNAKEVQLYYIKLLRVPNGKHIALFRVHHVIVDAYALMYMISYFDKCYAALSGGTELPPEGLDPIIDINKSWEYDNSTREETDIKWWKENLKSELHFTSINGKGNPEFVKGKNYGHELTMLQRMRKTITREIPKVLVDKVNENALKFNVSPQIFYMLALRTYLGIVSDTDDVTIDCTVARRATLVSKKSGMTRANMVWLRSVISPEISFADGIRQLSIIQRETYKHADFLVTSIGEVLKDTEYKAPTGATYKTVLMTYQPYFDIENAHFKFTAQQVTNGVASCPLYLNIMPLDATGSLWAYYQYAVGYTKPESLECFHKFMLCFIESGINSSEETIKALWEKCV